MTRERKNLEKNIRPTYENDYCSVKLNREIRNKFKSPDIVTVIKVYRSEWIGHVLRMDGERTANKLLEDKPGGSKKIGGPR